MMLTVIMLISSIIPAYAVNLNQTDNVEFDISFKAYYNLAATNRIVVSPDNPHLQSNSWIELKALHISDNYYEGFGHVDCDAPFDFVFNGEFANDTVKNVWGGI